MLFVLVDTKPYLHRSPGKGTADVTPNMHLESRDFGRSTCEQGKESMDPIVKQLQIFSLVN